MENDYDKIGANVIYPFRKNDKLIFVHNTKQYDLAPIGLIDFALSPLVFGADRLLAQICKMKSIENFEKGFQLIFSQEFLPNADIKINYVETKLSGYIYAVEELNLKGFYPGQKVWLCQAFLDFFQTPPNCLHMKFDRQFA